VTEGELTLLRSLAETDVVSFMPEDNTAAALARFDATVASLRLRDMEKAGWIELGVAQDEKRKRGHPQRKRTAAVRCTAGRRSGCAMSSDRLAMPGSGGLK
jgi:hypothetical protein